MHRGTTAVVAGAIAFAIGLFGTAPAAAVAEDGDEPSATLGSPLADSIVAAAAAGASTPAAIAAAVGLPATGAGSLRIDDDGRISVSISLTAAPTASQLEQIAASASIDRVLSFTNTVSARALPASFAALAQIDGVHSVVPNLTASTGGSSTDSIANLSLSAEAATADPAAVDLGDGCRSIAVDADGPLRTAEARELFGVDGTGVKIGVISDSFDNTTEPTSWTEDVALGALPGEGNPCGWTTPVTVLTDGVDGSDEGRAMAQLVHGIAPGAEIAFSAGGNSQATMAQSIIDLADWGADIIVDDLSYLDETMYQQSIISVAIESVKARGVAYFTSAGNGTQLGAADTDSAGLPISSWQTTAYRATSCPEWVVVPEVTTSYDCLDFDPGDAVDASQEIGFTTQDNPDGTLVKIGWGEAIYGVETTFELQVYNADSTLVTATSQVNSLVPVGLTGVPDPKSDELYRLVVVRTNADEAASSPAVWIGTVSGQTRWREYDRSTGDDIVGPISYGHAADGSATGVAASSWRTPLVPEDFSSIGPGTVLFEPVSLTVAEPAARLAEPLTVEAPVIAAVDGTRTTFFPADDPEHSFFGTSAAAPNMAAAFALGISYGASAEALLTAATTTTQAMTNPLAAVGIADVNVFGAGLVDAVAMIDAVVPAAVTGLTATATGPSEVSASWDAAADPVLVELVQGESVVTQTRLDAGSTGHVFATAEPETSYAVRVTSLTANGHSGDSASSAEVTTPAVPTPSPTPTTPTPTADPTHEAATAGTLATTGDDRTGMYLALGVGALTLLGGLVVIIIQAVRRRD